jgi:FkbM family methyltransferase
MLLDFNRLKREHNVNIEGVIHVGGHIGDELEEYRGIDNIIIFEPQKHCYDQLVAKAERIGLGGKFVNCALGNFIGEAEITSDPTGLTGSLLEPGLVVDYPDIVFSEKFMVDVSTLDEEIKRPHPYNFLNMDVQGYELEVLKGGPETLKSIDYVMTEVNRAEVYKKCVMIEDLTAHLEKFGLVKVAECWRGDWGDAFYVKK